MAKTKWLSLAFLSFILIFQTAFIACTRSQTQSDDRGILRKSITLNGLKRSYILYLPSTYHQSSAAPLVVALHGGGGTGKKVDKLLHLNSLADQYGKTNQDFEATNTIWKFFNEHPK
jgi:poly(3-hydroxybutyrate) depolymerase